MIIYYVWIVWRASVLLWRGFKTFYGEIYVRWFEGDL